MLTQCRALLIAVLLSGCGEDSPVVPAEFSVHSEEVEQGLLLSVLEHRGTVWAVGGRPDATFLGQVSEGTLTAVENPGETTAWWVCALGEEVAVVGDEGLILLQSGETFERLDLGIESTLYGCAGHSREDFWVVGGDPFLGPPELVHVVDGEGKAPELDLPVADLPKVFFKIAQFGDSVVVVGDDGVVLLGDDTGEWLMESVSERESLFTVSGNSVSDFWVVGGGVDGLAYHYNGKRFANESPKSVPGLSGVAVRGERVLAVGHRGLMLERVDGEWVELEALTDDTLHAVWQDDRGHAWAVGGNVLAPSPKAWRGVVLRR